MRLLLFSSFVLLSTLSNAQTDNIFFGFYGKVYVEAEKGNNVTIDLYDDNELISTYKTDKKGKFALDAPAAKHYTVVFSKDGFVTKKVIINTRKINSDKINPEDFAFDVNMIREIEYVDYSILDFPIALIEYQPKKKDFNYNKKYTTQMLKIQNRVIAESKTFVYLF